MVFIIAYFCNSPNFAVIDYAKKSVPLAVYSTKAKPFKGVCSYGRVIDLNAESRRLHKAYASLRRANRELREQYIYESDRKAGL